MMYETLYRYLIRNRKLDLPGIGVLRLQVQAARAAIVDHSFLPPKYSIQFEPTEEVPSEKLFLWLASNMMISEQEAVIRFNDFLFDVSRRLKEGKQIYWPRVGSFQKEVSGDIQFSPQPKEFPWIKPVVARKVTREDAQHRVLVGEKEKTSGEMIRLLNLPHESKESRWWVWPLALILALLILVGWYLSENSSGGFGGNKQKLTPSEAPSAYNLSP